MLRKLKTLLVVGVAALSIAFAGVQIADAHPGQHHGPPGYYEDSVTGAIKYFRNGHPGHTNQWDLVQRYRPTCRGSACDDAIALAEGGIALGYIEDFGVMGGGYLLGENLELTGQALATGKDKRIWCFVIPGFAFADVDLDLFAKVKSFVRTTGIKRWGLSATKVKTVGILNIDGSALALGTLGCPQFAEVSLRGRLTIGSSGYAMSVGLFGTLDNPQSITLGSGSTTVALRAGDEDFSTFLAYADIEGLVIIHQDLFVTAYVSEDGTTTYNFGIVTGGDAKALGDINIVGIRSSGQVMQSAFATDGLGALAYGNSMASYDGAKGDTYNGRCISFANGAGLAVVTGYNNVTNNGNSVSATSHQTAYATSPGGGYSGGGPQ
jgi:hypothetical protein